MQVPAELLLEDVALLVFPAQATGSCGSSHSGTIPSTRCQCLLLSTLKASIALLITTASGSSLGNSALVSLILPP